jgi:hypothetical protein
MTDINNGNILAIFKERPSKHVAKCDIKITFTCAEIR